MTLEDAVKACETAPRKVKLKIIRYSMCTQCQKIETEIGVYVIVSLNDSTVCVCYREDQPVTPKAKWNGKGF